MQEHMLYWQDGTPMFERPIVSEKTGHASGIELICLAKQQGVQQIPMRSTLKAATTLGMTASQEGPGTELKSLLRDWLGIEASPTCSCNAMARRMNAQGPDWCESDAGMAEILGVMRAEHAKRWADGRTRLPWTDLGARQLVRLACRRARAKASA